MITKEKRVDISTNTHHAIILGPTKVVDEALLRVESLETAETQPVVGQEPVGRIPITMSVRGVDNKRLISGGD